MGFLDKLTAEFKELSSKFDDKAASKDSRPVDSVHGHEDQKSTYEPQQAYPPQPQYSQQSYPPPPTGPQHQGPPGQPPLPAGWIAQYDQNSQRWYYVEQATGRTSWDMPAGPAGGHGSAPQYGAAQYGAPPYGGPQYSGPQDGYNNQYGGPGPVPYGGMTKSADGGPKKKSSDKKNMLLAGAGGLAAGGLVGAALADDDSDEERAHAMAAAPPPGAGGYGTAPGGAGYGPPPVPTGDESDRESLVEAQQDYNEAVAEAADSDASSSELEDLHEAREELQEEQEEYNED